MYAINTSGTIYTVNLTNGQSTQVATYNTSVVGSVTCAGGLVPSPVPGVKTFTGALKKKKDKYKALTLKHGKAAKVSVILTSAAGGSGQVVLVTSSNTTAIADFSLTVPAGQTTVNNFKTPKVSKTAKGQTVTLTASTPGGSQSVTVTIK